MSLDRIVSAPAHCNNISGLRDQASIGEAEFKDWLESTYVYSPPRSALARAIQYNLSLWKALARYVDDGRINIDPNLDYHRLLSVAMKISINGG